MSEEPGLLAVPNVSEGRNAGTIGQLAHAFAAEARVLDTHSDEAHNRTVFTLAPSQGSVVAALASGAREAIATIDMSTQDGEHPRIGSLDVAPVVYLSEASRGEAAAQALAVAEVLADLDVPVFLYGELASTPEHRERAFFRRGGPAELAERMRTGELQPDVGPAEPHATAGATLITARPPLAAFNIEIEGLTITQGREVAAALRESGGGKPGVRAIALPWGENCVQISTNVHDPVAIPLSEVVAAARELSEPSGGEVVAAEIVGLVPKAALEGFPADVPIPGFEPSMGVIEERLSH